MITKGTLIRAAAMAVAVVVFTTGLAFADGLEADADSLVAASPHPNSLNATQEAGTTVSYDFSLQINNTGNSSNDVFRAAFPGDRVNVTVTRGGDWLDASPGSPSSFSFAAYATPQAGTIRVTVPSGTTAGTNKTMTVALAASATNGQTLSPNSANLSFKITASAPSDTTAPDTFIDTNPDSPTNSTSASFTYHANEAGSSFLCSLDGAAFAACPVAGASYSSLGAGSHTFEVKAKDAAGNIDASPASFTWTVDLTAPNTSITDAPATLTNQTGASFEYSSSETNSSFECALDGASFAGCPAAGQSYSGLAEGSHTFAVKATDEAGNTDDTPASHAWIIDITPPAVSAPDLAEASDTGSSSIDDVTNDNTPTFTGTAEAGATLDILRGSDVVHTETVAAGGSWTYTSGSLADGSYTFTARATDGAGNAVTSAGLPVLIDTAAPSVSATAKKADLSSYAAGTWSNQAVTVTFACTDAGSGVDSVSAAETLSSDGADQSSTGSCSDVAGNSASTTFSNIDIDRTAPSIALASRTPANADAWNNTAVTVVWDCADTLSGAVAASVSDTKSSEGADQTANGTCTDNAGNSASDSLGNIDIDLTNPTITLSSRTPANGDGWNNTAVTVIWDCADALSGGVDASVSDVKTLEGADQVASQTCFDKAGNSASDSLGNIDIDLTNPTITLSSRTPANGSGWNNGDVTVVWSCADALSGPVAATVSQTLSAEGAGQAASGTCFDTAGNSSGASEPSINIDKTSPSITFASRLPGANGNGWNNTAVTVTWNCADPLSGPVAATVADTKSAEGAAQTANGTCNDLAGNTASASQSGISIDLTAPFDIQWLGGPAAGGSYYFGSVPGAPTCSASDALSGYAGCAVTGYSSLVGSHTMTATAADNAGNTATSTRSYSVLAWTISGFYQPVDMNGVWNTVKGGSTVPLKWEMFAGATELTDTSLVALSAVQVACAGGVGEDAVEVTATGGTVLRYDATGGQFIYNWQTPKRPGTCYRVTMTADDGSAITANFKLK